MVSVRMATGRTSGPPRHPSSPAPAASTSGRHLLFAERSRSLICEPSGRFRHQRITVRLPFPAARDGAGWARLSGARRRSRLRTDQPNRCGSTVLAVASHCREGAHDVDHSFQVRQPRPVARRRRQASVANGHRGQRRHGRRLRLHDLGADSGCGSATVRSDRRRAAPVPSVRRPTTAPDPDGDRRRSPGRRPSTSAPAHTPSNSRINKPLTLLGAQHGVDARTGRTDPAAETVFDVPAGAIVYVTTDDGSDDGHARRLHAAERRRDRGERRRQRQRPGLTRFRTTSSPATGRG